MTKLACFNCDKPLRTWGDEAVECPRCGTWSQPVWVAEHYPQMCSDEYRESLKRLGHTPYTAGRDGILGISKSTSQRYAREGGGYSVPVCIAKLLRAMVRLGTAKV
jgi:hypothetical protein